MKRMRDHMPTMDVKVLYTLDSSPHHTMVARIGRPIPVDIFRPASQSPSQVATRTDIGSSGQRKTKFGRVTLKTCLSAICIASPELIFDRRKDYTIYAVDPEESYRAMHQRSPSAASRTFMPLTQPSSDNLTANTSSTSSKFNTSPSSPQGLSSNSMLVGKGYFSWGLEEEGNGETTVTGRVRTEGRRTVYRNDHPIEEDIQVLEIVLRMRETQAQSKDQYFDLVRGFASNSAPSPFRSRQPSSTLGSEPKQTREPFQQSEPDLFYSRERKLSTPPTRTTVPRNVADVSVPPKAPSACDTSSIAVSNSSTTSIPSHVQDSSAAINSNSNSQAIQLLSVLQTLQSHQSQPGQQAPAPQQQAQLTSLLSLLAGALQTPAASPSASTPAPQQQILTQQAAASGSNHLLNAQPTFSVNRDRQNSLEKENWPGQVEEHSSSLAATNTQVKPQDTGNNVEKLLDNAVADDEQSPYTSSNTCYNCGTNSKTTWRTLSLVKGFQITFPASEKPPISIPASAWKYRYSDHPGPLLADGVCRWSACNPCGLYFIKYAESRPEYVWKRDLHNRKRPRPSRKEKQGAGIGEDKPAKKVKLSQAEGLSPIPPDIATPTNAADASTPGSARKSGLPRTLSEACHREAEKMENSRQEKVVKIDTRRVDKANEFALDGSGRWRTRRSIKNNPMGIRPGRPKGSKKAESKGRTQDLKNQDAQDETSPPTSTRSSPGPEELPGLLEQPRAPKVGEFQVPQLPGPSSSQFRSVNFAQSSPIRHVYPMHNDRHGNMARSSNSIAPFESPSRDVRFRVPSYLMNSSPTTMIDTLMSEADCDFEELGPLATPGSLINATDLTSFGSMASLRRSPRKQQYGSASNAYTLNEAPSSPSLGHSNQHGAPSQVNTNPSSNDSPVTRSRTRSGQGSLHPALFSSSGSSPNPKRHTKTSSEITSPSSPISRSSTKTATNGRNRAIQAHLLSPQNHQTLRRSPRSHKLNMLYREEDGDGDDDVPEEQLVKGPYQVGSKEESADIPDCPPSPSLGRVTRKLSRTDSKKDNGPAKLAQLDLPPSSPPMFDVEVDRWGGTPSLREIFQTPSDLDWASDGTPAQPTPSGPTTGVDEIAKPDATLFPSSAASFQALTRKKADQSDQTKLEKEKNRASETAPVSMSTFHAQSGRKPLPATVEDASPSDVGSSSPNDEDSPEQSANLFDLLEDPYDLLAASGFGLAEVEGGRTGISADNFNNIELHHSIDFGTQLNQFTHTGGVGVAAHVSDIANNQSVITTTSTTSSSNNTTTPRGRPTLIENGNTVTPIAFDASSQETTNVDILSQYPDLFSFLTSPKKSNFLPQQIVEIFSPGKNKNSHTVINNQPFNSSTSSSSSSSLIIPSKTDQDPIYSGDLMALLNNTDIQSMLAEFGNSEVFPNMQQLS